MIFALLFLQNMKNEEMSTVVVMNLVSVDNSLLHCMYFQASQKGIHIVVICEKSCLRKPIKFLIYTYDCNLKNTYILSRNL